MYKIVRGVQAYDDIYDTESPQPYPFAIPLSFILKFMQNLIIPGGLENYVLHNIRQVGILLLYRHVKIEGHARNLTSQ